MRSLYSAYLRWALRLLPVALVAPPGNAQPAPDAKLTSSLPLVDQQFGAAVALDGVVAVVGAFREDDPVYHVGEYGAAYVYRYDGSAWREEQKLTSPQRGNYEWYGRAVAVSGNVVLVSTRNDEGLPVGAGAVYVYRYDGSTWAEAQKLRAPDEAQGGDFGHSLAIEGDVMLVGSAIQGGAAYVFRYDGSTWAEEQKLTSPESFSGTYFGESVALSGSRALIGAWGYEPPQGLNTGAAYVFEYDGSMWNETARLVPSDSLARTQFGLTVALDGDRALIGAPLDREVGASAGAAYVFHFDGAAWANEQKITASDPSGFNLFGSAVALEGTQALVGAKNWFPLNEDASGKAYRFAYDAVTESWVEQQGFVPSDGGAGDDFGSAVAMDDGVVLVGAPDHDQPVAATGAAYIYGVPTATAVEDATPHAPTLLSVPVPNPFRTQTLLTLTLAEPQAVTMDVYDLLGRRVAVLHEGLLAAGAHPFVWNAGSLPAGPYVVRVVGVAVRASRRVVLVR